MFPAVVDEIIYEAGKKFQHILKVEIFNGIEDREIESMIRPFQIYEVNRYKKKEDYIVITEGEVCLA